MHPSLFQFAIGATFTADPLQSVLAFWGRQLDAGFDTRFAPYNQLHQALLDPHSVFASNHHGVNVALVRIEDLGQFSGWTAETRTTIEGNLRSLLNAVRDVMLRLRPPLILCLCPPSDAALADPAVKQWLDSMETLVERFLDDVSRVHRLPYHEVLRQYPVVRWNDPAAERLGHIPYTEEFFCSLGTAIARFAHALFTPPYKVIVSDCDNTLWSGVCGEDGPGNVVIDEVRAQLQQFALDRREEGALLAIASKNNEQDVLDTFAAQRAMPLRLDHFVTWRINWDPKPRNLVEIAGELSLGLDSFVFLDDNPRECAEVADALPQVLSLTLPEPPSAIPHFLRHVWAFDRPVVTEEDRRRNAYYSQAQEFGRELKQAESFDQFLASLRLAVDLHPPREDELSRVAQLTRRTNQFNFTTVPRTEGEIQSLLRQDGAQCLAARVTDRFGDYGLVGVVITRDADRECDVETFLLSCRVLGRGVEHRILSSVARGAIERGCSRLRLRWIPTGKNLPARQFLETVTGVPIDPEFEFLRSIPANVLTGLRYVPAAIPPPPEPKRTRAAHPPERRCVDFARIARDLSTPGQILEAMRVERNGGAPAVLEPGLSESEERLAVIWRDLLGAATVSRTDNFFDIGGHSLLAVLLIVRVKETFGVELPVEDVYSPTMTLENLALKIENYQLSRIDPSEYAGLLAEIEQLSEEEVLRLLEEEGTGAQQ